MNESCHTYERVMSHTFMSLSHIFMSLSHQFMSLSQSCLIQACHIIESWRFCVLFVRVDCTKGLLTVRRGYRLESRTTLTLFQTACLDKSLCFVLACIYV